MEDGELVGEANDACELSADLGMRGCPSGGKQEWKMNARDMSLLWDNAPSHKPNTPNRASTFQKWVQDKLGFKGVMCTPPCSAWFNPIELFFSCVKQCVRKCAPRDAPSLLQRVREEATVRVTGTMMRNWFKKCGFRVDGEEDDAAEQEDQKRDEEAADRCSLPNDARFARREHVVCVDSEGQVRREKKRRHTRWSKCDEDVDEKELKNVSVVKRTGIRKKRGTARTMVISCPRPEDEATRHTGVHGDPPVDVEHGDHSDLHTNEGDMAQVERVCDEKVADDGLKEHKVKWKTHSQPVWIHESKLQGLPHLLQHIRRNQGEDMKVMENKRRAAEAAEAADEELKACTPDNSSFQAGDMVALLPPRGEKDLFYVAKVINVMRNKLLVHWWSAKRLDGVWSPDHRRPMKRRARGHAGAHTSRVDESSVMDKMQSLHGAQRGAMHAQHLKRLTKLAREARRAAGR
mgnify:CR=1 FL=1